MEPEKLKSKSQENIVDQDEVHPYRRIQSEDEPAQNKITTPSVNNILPVFYHTVSAEVQNEQDRVRHLENTSKTIFRTDSHDLVQILENEKQENTDKKKSKKRRKMIPGTEEVKHESGNSVKGLLRKVFRGVCSREKTGKKGEDKKKKNEERKEKKEEEKHEETQTQGGDINVS